MFIREMGNIHFFSLKYLTFKTRDIGCIKIDAYVSRN